MEALKKARAQGRDTAKISTSVKKPARTAITSVSSPIVERADEEIFNTS